MAGVMQIVRFFWRSTTTTTTTIFKRASLLAVSGERISIHTRHSPFGFCCVSYISGLHIHTPPRPRSLPLFVATPFLLRGFMNSLSSSSASSGESFFAPKTAARVVREVQDLLKNPESGVRLIVDDATGLPANLRELMAEVEGPKETPYEGKYFLLRFTFGAEFPSTPPTAHFLTKVYHPNIDLSTGAVCVNTLKRDWKPVHTLKHCLAVIRCLLLQPFPDSALNEDAGKLFMESYAEYFKRARLHADVHGRPGTTPPLPPPLADPRVLASRNQGSSDKNTLLTTMTLPANSNNKLTKKKSLKRL